MSKDNEQVITAIRALLDDLEADWAARRQDMEPEPESTDRLVIDAIGIGRTQIIVDVRKLLDDLEAEKPLHNREPAALSGYGNGPKRPGVG